VISVSILQITNDSTNETGWTFIIQEIMIILFNGRAGFLFEINTFPAFDRIGMPRKDLHRMYGDGYAASGTNQRHQ